MIVADINVTLFLLVNNPEFSPGARAAYGRDPAWHAPAFWRNELRNTLMKYVRHDETTEIPGSEMTLEEAIACAGDAEAIVQSAAIAPAEEVLRLAARSGCSPYDCEYVRLAQRLGTRLLTYDVAVLDAFPSLAVRPEEFVAET